MNDALPAEVKVESTADGVRYVLPAPAGIPGFIGALLIGFGLIPIAMGVAFIIFSLRILEAPFPFKLFVLLMWVVPLLFVLAGLALTFLGAYFLAGRTEIELTRDTLSAAMCVGPIRWRGRRSRRQVLGLAVEHPRGSAGSESSPAQLAGCQLAADCDGARRLVLAFGHGRGMLAALAGHISRRWAQTDGEMTLPVREVEQTAGSSRSWRRAEASPLRASSGCTTLFNILFFVPFLAGGCLFFCLIVTALIRGDPGNNLQGNFPIKYLWALFPLPFIAIGAGGLLHHFRQRSQVELSPEQKAVEGTSADAADSPRAALPTVPEVSTTPGSELAHRLAWKDSPGLALVGFLILLLICSGVLTPVVYNVLLAVRAGKLLGWVGFSGFFVLFLGLIWVLLAGAAFHNWREWRLGQPIVEVSDQPLYPGETCELWFSLPGTMRLRRLEVTILCEEEARYRQGTDTRTETRCVHREELLGAPEARVEAGPLAGVRHRFRVPPGAMHSFEATNNKVRWVVRVEGKAVGMFGVKFKHDFPLVVHPPREGAVL